MMSKKKAKLTAKEAYHQGTDYQFATNQIALGPWTSYSLLDDPKHMCFVLSRYKFCAKMLKDKKTIMEVGPGDGFGLPIMAQMASQIYAVDWDPRLLNNCSQRLSHLKNVNYLHVDCNEQAPHVLVEGIYMIDVIEHIDPANEKRFMDNIIGCLKPDGILIVGTPNITAAQYGTARSKVQHINLKSMQMLHDMTANYCQNVFMFGMNDEVVHTGYDPMCHYIWAVGAGLKPKLKKNQ